MQKVEYVGTSIDQKLNHALKCSNIMLEYSASILQLKARVKTQKYSHKKQPQNKKKNKFGHCRACITSKTKCKNMNLTSNTNYPCMGMRKAEDEMVPPQSVVVGEGSTPG